MKTLTDITTLVAVQSLFEPGVKDPWGPVLAGQLGDWFVYSDNPQFILPRPSDWAASSPWEPPTPGIVNALRQRESRGMSAVAFETGPVITLRDELYDETIRAFDWWCGRNRTRLGKWLELHKQKWALEGYSSRIPTKYLFDVRRVLEDPRFVGLSNRLMIGREDLAYALDVALRYARYGELAGEEGLYLSHPLREKQQLPTVSLEPLRNRPVALSFAKSVSTLAPQLSLDEYSSLLHEIRSIVDREGLRHAKRGSLEPEAIREIAAELNLPVKLRAWSKTTAAGAGILSGLTAIDKISAWAGIGAAVVRVGALFYHGSVPAKLGSYKWIRPALHWPIEDEAENNED